MIRMFSGLAAPVVGGLVGMFRKNGELSAYRVVLAITLVAAALGLWTGWVQWVVFGEGVLAGGFLAGLGTFAARWAIGAWLTIVLLWTGFGSDKDDLVGGSFAVFLFVSLLGTVGQAMYTCGVFIVAERTHYRATVSCEHCGASCYASVRVGESWTDWESVECCQCGIKVHPESVPEYAESKGAWDTRVMGNCSDGTED